MSERFAQAAAIRAMPFYIVKAATGFLALSTESAPIRIGVPGATEEEARRNFEASRERWAQLTEQP